MGQGSRPAVSGYVRARALRSEREYTAAGARPIRDEATLLYRGLVGLLRVRKRSAPSDRSSLGPQASRFDCAPRLPLLWLRAGALHAGLRDSISAARPHIDDL